MQRLPLFVLPTVLLPRDRVPLHVFEPRYRQMVARCLEFDKRFGFLFHRHDLYGDFQLRAGRVGCVAEIQAFQPLPDGRSLMVTRGVERFQVKDALETSALYHEAVVEDYGDEPEDRVDLIVRRRRTLELFKELLRRLPDSGDGYGRLNPLKEISFAVAARIEIDPVWHQGILELKRESDRLDRIDALLRSALQRRRDLATDDTGDPEG